MQILATLSPRARAILSSAALAALVSPLLAAAPAAASHPSFDCARASRDTEIAICGSRDLARIDRAHANLYYSTIEQAERVSDRRAVHQIRDAERVLLRERDACGRDEWCIRDVYALAGSKMRQFLRQLD